uniref:ATP synthase complex subunit 8 n=1 Tax=Diorhabda carinata TaxID=1163344 RepID=A0A4Y5MUM7_9CUCU|nr:ATP synthase F0 subunit 8 [Diorhabda carinata]QCW06684.1 ATP synthase F0 subunit 8 [Diorhabda carinata]
MPQMMPLYWLTLMFFFLSIFFCFNNLNYFNFFYSIKMTETKINKMNFNWKW